MRYLMGSIPEERVLCLERARSNSSSGSGTACGMGIQALLNLAQSLPALGGFRRRKRWIL
jgi:hypothetical protein